MGMKQSLTLREEQRLRVLMKIFGHNCMKYSVNTFCNEEAM
jgi:hypothetical protein